MKMEALLLSSYSRCIWRVVVLALAVALPMAAAASPNRRPTPADVLSVMQRVADWQLAHPSVHPMTDWTQAAGDAGMSALAGISSDPKYRDALLAVGEAHNRVGVLLRPINEGKYRPEATMTFGQFLNECWGPAVVPHLKPTSFRYYGKQIQRHLLPTFGGVRIRDITRAEVQRFLGQNRKQGLSGSSVPRIRTALGKVLQAAVDWNYLDQNPARAIRLGDRTPVQERAYLLPDQLSALLNSLCEPCRTLIVITVLTGLRIGELLALRWKHIDFMHSAIHVRETVYEGRFGSPKTKSSRRDVPMSQPVREAFQAQQSVLSGTDGDSLIFTCRNGTPLNPKNLLRRALQPACRELGLPVIGWHSFRHTHATLLGEVGESLRTAQAILGQSDLKTTLNVYTHAIRESQKRAVAKVAGLMFPNVPEFSANPENGNVN